MKMSQASIAVLLGAVTAIGTAAYGQSGSGGGGGGASGATGGAASTGGAGVAGSTGAPGTIGGNAGGSRAGVGTGVGPAVGRGAGAVNPYGGDINHGERNFQANPGFRAGAGAGFNRSNPGTNARGATPFNDQRNRQGFQQNTQQNNQAFNRNTRSFGQNRESFNQPQNSTNQIREGTFDDGGQGSFSQGMTNQGAFGLGSGNRSSFFDNQPFNDQGFGQGGSGNDFDGDFTAEDGAFVDADSAFDDSNRTFDDRGMSGNRFDDSSSFGSDDSGFDRGFDDGESEDSLDTSQSRDGQDLSSGEVPAGFGMTSDAESGINAGAGSLSSRGVTGANNPAGFAGTVSPLSRSSDGEIGAANDSPSNHQGSSDFGSFDPQRQQNFERELGALNNQPFGENNPAQVRFGQGTASTFQSSAPTPRATGVTTNGTNVPPSQPRVRSFDQDGSGEIYDTPVRPGQYFNRPEGSQPGLGPAGPGGYGFMQQYSDSQTNPQGRQQSGPSNRQQATPQRTQTPARTRNQDGAGARSSEGAGQQRDSQTPNYFNGVYSRSRL